VAMAAMIATLEGLSEAHYRESSVRGQRLQDGIRAALSEAGIKAQVFGFPLMFHISFGLDAVPRNYREIALADKRGYVQFCVAMLKRGVRALERGAWFVSSEHDDAVVDETIAVVREAAKEVAQGLGR
jgi:glutamate-1-semialdehyde 2,1-aminomutase